jgi:protein-S-isoprenylcysteine O-methyltransferase Ste14
MIVVKTLTWSIIFLVHGMVTVFVPCLLLHATIQLLTDTLGGFRWLSLALIIGGAVGILWSGWSLTLAGKGTPAPFDPPKEFVVRGLYRFVRNPMYGSDLLVLLGESLLFESVVLLLYAVVMLCGFHLFVVLYEEPTLKRQFGQSYEWYHKSVPRWIPYPGSSSRP